MRVHRKPKKIEQVRHPKPRRVPPIGMLDLFRLQPEGLQLALSGLQRMQKGPTKGRRGAKKKGPEQVKASMVQVPGHPALRTFPTGRETPIARSSRISKAARKTKRTNGE